MKDIPIRDASAFTMVRNRIIGSIATQTQFDNLLIKTNVKLIIDVQENKFRELDIIPWLLSLSLI